MPLKKVKHQIAKIVLRWIIKIETWCKYNELNLRKCTAECLMNNMNWDHREVKTQDHEAILDFKVEICTPSYCLVNEYIEKLKCF